MCAASRGRQRLCSIVTHRLALLAATAATLLTPAAAHAAGDVPRPHSDFTIRDQGVRIARFDVYAQPRDGRIRVGVTMTARARSRDLTLVLRIGRCTRGRPTLPTCEPNASRRVRLHPSKTSIVHMTALVPRPFARTNAIRISLTPRGRIVRAHRDPFAGIVDMLLPASAWTKFPAVAFGVRIARPWEGDGLPVDVRALTALGTQVSATALRASLQWHATAPPATPITTVFGPCAMAIDPCVPFSGVTTLSPVGTGAFSVRRTLEPPNGTRILEFKAATAGNFLFGLRMPWPR